MTVGSKARPSLRGRVTRWRRIIPAVIVLAMSGSARVAAQGTSDDDRMVRDVVLTIVRAWRDRDVNAMAAVYAPDAEWINAFGIQRRGREQIRAFVGRVLRSPQRDSVKPGVDSIISVRFPAPTVAIVHEYGEQDGQRFTTGATVGVRRTHWLLVLQKIEGAWLVVSHLVMDERGDPGDPLIRAERVLARAIQQHDTTALQLLVHPAFTVRPAEVTARSRDRAAWIRDAGTSAPSADTLLPRILSVQVQRTHGEVKLMLPVNRERLAAGRPAAAQSASPASTSEQNKVAMVDSWIWEAERWQLIGRVLFSTAPGDPPHR